MVSELNELKPEGETKVESLETAYQVRNHSVEFEVDVIINWEDRDSPSVELEGNLWIDGSAEPEVTVETHGPWMAHPKLPAGHPIVRENEDEYSTHEIHVGEGVTVTDYETPPRYLRVPDEFYETVFDVCHQIVNGTRQRALRLADELGCEIEVLTTWADKAETVLYAEAVLKSHLGEFRLHCRRGSMTEPNWRFYAPERIPNEYSAVLHHYVHNNLPISREDYAEEVENAARGDETVLPEESPEPVCQAKDCSAAATRASPSPDGYPDNGWKLCEEHFSEARGYDPYRLSEKDWSLRKLRHR